MKIFSKNDNDFTCVNCKNYVEKLGYSSRDHCPFCLCSLHVDINPGDRLNTCCGLMIPEDVSTDSKKGYVIEYKCTKCGATHKNKSAIDDNFSTILKLMNKSYNHTKYQETKKTKTPKI